MIQRQATEEQRLKQSREWMARRAASARTIDFASSPSETPPPQLLTKELAGRVSDEQLLNNPIVTRLFEDINACQNSDQLYAMGCLVWERRSANFINDDEASYLVACIGRRKPVSRRTSAGKFAVISKVNGRVGSRFLPRQYQRSPDRKASRDRRRMLGGSSALPDSLRHHYTEGQRSVLCIVAGEIKRQGVCDMPIDKIAALAGVCRTTVQTAMHEARRLGHIKITERPVPGRKNMSNLVEVVSREWLAWIKRGPSAARGIGSNPVKIVSPTKSVGLSKSKKRLSKKAANQAGSDPPSSPVTDSCGPRISP